MNVLLITSKSDVTTDFIVRELKSQHITFYRLNTEEIGSSVQLSLNIKEQKYLIIDQLSSPPINLLEVTSVYFRRPEIKSNFDEVSPGELNFLRSELAFSLEGLYKILRNAFWINTVDDIRKAENKIYQLMLAQEIGFKVPASIITNQPANALDFYIANRQSCIIKPIKSGLIENGIEEGIIFTSKLTLNEDIVDRIFGCPVFIQQLIEKEADVRITVVGQRLFAAKIHSQITDESSIDWRKASSPLPHSPIDLPQNIIDQCLELTRRLNLNFGAIDMVLDTKGTLFFLEINPNGQWAWIERKLNFPIAKAITELLIEKAA